MTTPKQARANRQNGKKGRGPTSEHGKKKSSQNSLKHGLTAKTTVVSGEDQAKYDELRSALFEDHRSGGVLQHFLWTSCCTASGTCCAQPR